MECPVCLLADDVDTDGARCVCGRLFHASCVYALLKHGYKTCPTCFALLPPNLVLLGASHGHSLNGSELSTIDFAAALTGAHRARESLSLLRSIRPVTCTRLRAVCSDRNGTGAHATGFFHHGISEPLFCCRSRCEPSTKRCEIASYGLPLSCVLRPRRS